MAKRHSNNQMSQIFNYDEPRNNQPQQDLTSPTTSQPYYSRAHASPYINGKKNASFAHPSYVSNQVFYAPESILNNNQRQKGDYDQPANQREEYQEPRGNRYKNEREDEPRPNQGYNYRDDRSEASTLSSEAYICPNCLNKHLSEDQKSLCRRLKEEDMEKERRVAEINQRLKDEEEAQERYTRSRRVNEGHNLKEKLDREHEERLEYRRSPKKDGSGSGFDNMFERQEDLVRRQKNLNQEFGSTLKDQMRQESNRKTQEKEWNSSSYQTSLRIGEGYRNKYLDGKSSNLGYDLKEQAEDRASKQQRERELEKRFAQERSEKELREQEEEENRRKEKEWRQKREYKDQLLKTIDDKKNKEREELLSKQSERTVLDSSYAEYKRRQAEEEERAKKQLASYGQNLKNQQHNSSYTQQYEERRGHKDQTSFDPPSKTKKLYACGDCHVPYERAYLTKYQ